MTLTYAVLDTETTGFDHEEDALVEIAAVHSSGKMFQSLVCPGERRISFGAMATHHITPSMVEMAPVPLQALAHVGLPVPTEKHRHLPDILVFHNAGFDRGFLPDWLQALPYICTWRCALHLYPSAESHSNGSLWYELGLSHNMPVEAGRMPHRALFDAIMTSDILAHFIDLLMCDRSLMCLEEDAADPDMDAALTHLVWLSKQPVLLTKCRFGKHREERWEDIPTSYMSWVLTQDFDEDTKHTCRHWLQRRGRL